ncbi:MAG: TIGR02757 family protein [Bacteroidetes bacterium]|jgi:uncharacterized protein (TIGR02757 family)|nr:TIGR02757 family protein [Bacteroidota bacterium]
MERNEIHKLLENKYIEYNRWDFIPQDPVSIPHLFSTKRDIEIAGFFAATLAWGRRKTIIDKCKELLKRMDMAPYQFVVQCTATDRERLNGFVHRTFNALDLDYFISRLGTHYRSHESLESLFLHGHDAAGRLQQFVHQFVSGDGFVQRTAKHLPTPARNATCKRLNMYLRWMVRTDPCGVDFGIWKQIRPADLMCPLDVHVARVGAKLGLLRRKQMDWMAVEELTAELRRFDPSDPVKYDYALFGLGVSGLM